MPQTTPDKIEIHFDDLPVEWLKELATKQYVQHNVRPFDKNRAKMHEKKFVRNWYNYVDQTDFHMSSTGLKNGQHRIKGFLDALEQNPELRLKNVRIQISDNPHFTKSVDTGKSRSTLARVDDDLEPILKKYFNVFDSEKLYEEGKKDFIAAVKLIEAKFNNSASLSEEYMQYSQPYLSDLGYIVPVAAALGKNRAFKGQKFVLAAAIQVIKAQKTARAKDLARDLFVELATGNQSFFQKDKFQVVVRTYRKFYTDNPYFAKSSTPEKKTGYIFAVDMWNHFVNSKEAKEDDSSQEEQKNGKYKGRRWESYKAQCID